MKQLATTGAGACVVQNYCQTVHSFLHIGVVQKDSNKVISCKKNKTYKYILLFIKT
jgi:hypothetical protein